MSLPAYATREAVKRALDSAETARNNTRIDAALASASRNIDKLCRRRFYPEYTTRSFDWPNRQYAYTWRLWLESNELISATAVTSGGVTIDPASYFLRRMDDLEEPPYTHLEINVGSLAGFSAGVSWQKSIQILGWFGYRDDQVPAGALAGAVADATTTSVTVSNSDAVGIGDLLRVESERMIVTGRSMAATGQSVVGTLDAALSATGVTVGSGAAFSVGETILIDTERMLVEDVAGNVLVVKRAWDGSVLAAHTGSGIWAPRLLMVERGAVGTTAAAHGSGAAVYRWVSPPLVAQLAVAEAMVEVGQQSASYAASQSAGEAMRASFGGVNSGLADLRDRVCRAHRRRVLGPVAV